MKTLSPLKHSSLYHSQTGTWHLCFLHLCTHLSLPLKCVWEKQKQPLSAVSVCSTGCLWLSRVSASWWTTDAGNQTNNQCCTLCVILKWTEERKWSCLTVTQALLTFLLQSAWPVASHQSDWSRVTASSGRCSDAAVLINWSCCSGGTSCNVKSPRCRAAWSGSGNADCVLGFQLMDQIKFYFYGSKSQIWLKGLYNQTQGGYALLPALCFTLTKAALSGAQENGMCMDFSKYLVQVWCPAPDSEDIFCSTFYLLSAMCQHFPWQMALNMHRPTLRLTRHNKWKHLGEWTRPRVGRHHLA